MSARFFFPDALPENGREVWLPDDIVHHATRVLRLGEGQEIVLFDGQGGEFPAQLQRSGNQWTAHTQPRQPVNRESPLNFIVVQALAAADRMDWIVRKSVELGARAIIPIKTQRCVLRLEGDRLQKRLTHWRQIAIAACEQCGRNVVPQVEEITDLSAFLTAHRKEQKWLCEPGENSTPLSKMPAPAADEPIYLMVGPEGGWSDGERAACKSAECKPIVLGPRTLRTESAAMSILAAAMVLWGDG